MHILPRPMLGTGGPALGSSGRWSPHICSISCPPRRIRLNEKESVVSFAPVPPTVRGHELWGKNRYATVGAGSSTARQPRSNTAPPTRRCLPPLAMLGRRLDTASPGPGRSKICAPRRRSTQLRCPWLQLRRATVPASLVVVIPISGLLAILACSQFPSSPLAIIGSPTCG